MERAIEHVTAAFAAKGLRHSDDDRSCGDVGEKPDVEAPQFVGSMRSGRNYRRGVSGNGLARIWPFTQTAVQISAPDPAVNVIAKAPQKETRSIAFMTLAAPAFAPIAPSSAKEQQ